MPFELTIDSNLPLPIGAQLRGLVEYGISTGELQPGSRLPSVRELAEQVGIAPMTVSQAYKDMQAANLIEGRPGQGTFVRADVRAPMSPDSDAEQLQQRVDQLIQSMLDHGFSASDVTRVFNARLSRMSRKSRALTIVMVGTFEQTIADYATALHEKIYARDRVIGITVDELLRDPALCDHTATADLVLTFANRKGEVAELIGKTVPIIPISYIPSDATRVALAGLDPVKRVGLVSTFTDFLPIMKAGVQRLAPQIGPIQATALEFDDLDNVINDVETVIYATGAEQIISRLPRHTNSFEYRHVLHPLEIQNTVLPMIETLRNSTAAQLRPDQSATELSGHEIG